MQITVAKLSEEIVVSGRHYWIGFEANVMADDNPPEVVKELQEMIDKFSGKKYTPWMQNSFKVEEPLPIINENER